MDILFSTAVTPGACQAARSASARSAQDLTVPVSVTLEPTVSTVMLPASSSALRFKSLMSLATPMTPRTLCAALSARSR